jgi:hypothetical protein
MRTKIVALFSALVFLVFIVLLNLSCQKDNGVESAGNNSKGKPTSMNNTTGTDKIDCQEYSGGPRYYAIIELYESGSNVPLYTYQYDSDELIVANQVYRHYTLPDNGNADWDVKVTFRWENCLPFCQYSYYWGSHAGRVCNFSISNDEGKVMFGTCLRKPYGSPNGQGPVSGEDSFLYAPLRNNVYQLEAGNKYWFSGWWGWGAPEPSNNIP